MRQWLGLTLSAIVLILAGIARADGEAYYRVPITGLKLVEGRLPAESKNAANRWRNAQRIRPYAVLEGAGEVYLAASDELAGGPNRWIREWTLSEGVLLARAPAGSGLQGWVFLPNPDWTGLVPAKFTIDAAAASPEAQRPFYVAKEAHYAELLDAGFPGGALFRLQADEARRELDPDARERSRWNRRRPELDDTYDLFTGGQAVSESLQLSRDLPPAGAGAPSEDAPVPVSSIEGITVDAMEWPASPPGQRADALAAAIPSDQHAAFFPSFEALMAMLDQTASTGLPLYRTLAVRSEDGRLLERYERQLGLNRGPLARLLGPALVQSVAVTGSDPYFPTGTDLAVLFETTNTEALKQALIAQVRASAPQATSETGETDGVTYARTAIADRAVCSYIAAIGGTTVVVTNSPVQLRRLAAVQAGKAASIASLPEYRFFRGRYPVGGAGETGFVFLSDATIRRWCGPQWRIGASRRLRAAAVLSDLTASHMDDLVTGVSEERPVTPSTPMRTIGELTIGPRGVRSSVYGSLGFLTPIAELGITEVATDEARSYKRWRDTYQQNWSWAFDPIAVTFSLSPSGATADLTVMPLILGSGYKMWMDVARGTTLAPGAGDPHDAIAHGVLAINREARALTEGAGFLKTMAGGLDIDPLGWLGKAVALYADPDPFWGEMLSSRDEQFLEKNLGRLPVALYVEVDSALKLTAFLSALRGFIDQSAPGMMAWDNRSHHDQGYVRVRMSDSARERGGGGEFDKVAIHYAAMPRALIVSFNEDLLKRAIDRERSRKDGDAPRQPWLGESMGLRFTSAGLDLTAGPGRATLRDATQRRAWANIPILNEWKRRYPKQDPVAVHEARWGVRLACPAGGEYRWNERFKTMESTVLGCPGDPKDVPGGTATVQGVAAGNLGVTFEDKGLRARAVLERSPSKP